MDQLPYLTVVISHGGTLEVVSDLGDKYGSFVCKGRRTNQYFLVGLLHNPEGTSPTNKRFVQSRKQLVQEAPKLRKALVRVLKLDKLPTITSCIVTFGSGTTLAYHGLRAKRAAPKTKKPRKPSSKPRTPKTKKQK